MENGVFAGCKKLETAKIEAKLTYLPASTFSSASSLKNVELPTTIKRLNDKSFYGCSSLRTIDLPEGLEEIDGWVFGHADIRYVVFPKSLKKLGDYSFYNNKYLDRVKFLNQATEIIKTPLGCDIVGYEKSNAQAYAENNNLKFILIGSDEDKNYVPNLADNPRATTTTTTATNTTTATTTIKTTSTAKPSATTTTTTTAPSGDSASVRGDANGDGMVDARDASLILAYYAKASAGYAGSIDDYIKDSANK